MRQRDLRDGDGQVLVRDRDRAVRPELPDGNKGRVEETIAEGIEHEENAIGQWVNYLNVVASIAPMILTTDVLITDVPAKENAPAMPPGGMGGMDY